MHGPLNVIFSGYSTLSDTETMIAVWLCFLLQERAKKEWNRWRHSAKCCYLKMRNQPAPEKLRK